MENGEEEEEEEEDDEEVEYYPGLINSTLLSPVDPGMGDLPEALSISKLKA